MTVARDAYGVPLDSQYALLSDMVSAIRQWGEDRGIHRHSTTTAQLAKLVEEIGELAGGVVRKKRDVVMDSIGDAIVVLVNIAAIEGLSVGDCVFAAWTEIRDRKGRMNSEGVFVKESDERSQFDHLPAPKW